MNHVQKANTLKGNAEMASQSMNYKESSSLFEKAGTYYKLAKEWKMAADVFNRAAVDSMKFGPHMAATYFKRAAELYVKCEDEAAVKAFENAAENFIDNSRLSMAAKAYDLLGEFHEKKERLVLAIESHSTAADLYGAESSPAQSAMSMRKVGNLSVLVNDYSGGAVCFEAAAESYVGNTLGEFIIPGCLLSSILCHIAAEVPGRAIDKLSSYEDDFPTFKNTRERVFALSLCNAFDGDYLDMFMKDSDLSFLRPWQKVLLEIIGDKSLPNA